MRYAGVRVHAGVVRCGITHWVTVIHMAHTYSHTHTHTYTHTGVLVRAGVRHGDHARALWCHALGDCYTYGVHIFTHAHTQTHTQGCSCVLECDMVIMPVHCGTTHWATACVDLKNRRFLYWDSLWVSWGVCGFEF